ncbi:MAG: DsbE family thiol:disulfide interchange protein [Burkholderiales bacterium]
MNRFVLPLGLFVVLVIFLAIGLRLNPREVPSPLIDKPAPAFSLVRLDQPQVALAPADFRGRVWILNVWASWCAACLEEHPVLIDLAKKNIVPLVGFNYKDAGPDAHRWLARHGNPYEVTVVDADGRAGIDWGVYGAPETFVIDKEGFIRYKRIGPVTPQLLDDTILPLVRRLQG